MNINHLKSFFHELVISNVFSHSLSSFAVDLALMCSHNIKFLKVNYKCVLFPLAHKFSLVQCLCFLPLRKALTTLINIVQSNSRCNPLLDPGHMHLDKYKRNGEVNLSLGTLSVLYTYTHLWCIFTLLFLHSLITCLLFWVVFMQFTSLCVFITISVQNFVGKDNTPRTSYTVKLFKFVKAHFRGLLVFCWFVRI